MFGLSAALYFRCTKTGSGGKFCVVSHSLMCGSLTLGIWVPGYRKFVVEDINHHALRRVRQWSQFLAISSSRLSNLSCKLLEHYLLSA